MNMFKDIIENVRKKTPIIHCITNYVTANDCANIVLACGGSPIMADDVHEVEEVTAISDGLCINIGTLNSQKLDSMLLAGKKAQLMKHVILLDPVGVGVSSYRKNAAKKLIDEVSFTAIRGNISEIKALALGCRSTKGIDSDFADSVTEDNLDNAIEFVKSLSLEVGSIIAVTGKIDLVADSDRCFVIRNGRHEMRSVTGTGCQLSAIMTAFMAANTSSLLESAAAAVCTMGIAGEIGYLHLAEFEGNAAYRNRIIDAVSLLDGGTLRNMANFEIR